MISLNRYGYSRLIVYFFSLYFLLFGIIGCEAVARKFTRKPKKEPPKEELVIMPEEYRGPQMTKEDLYRQYLLFWRSWQDELIESLGSNTNQKKRLDAISEAIKNLTLMRGMLNKDKQERLDYHISQMVKLKDEIKKDIYGMQVFRYRSDAQRIKANILQEFSYHKIRDSLN